MSFGNPGALNTGFGRLGVQPAIGSGGGSSPSVTSLNVWENGLPYAVTETAGAPTGPLTVWENGLPLALSSS